MQHYSNNIILAGGLLLLLRRTPYGDSTLAGEWCLPGGHVDAGEEYFDACVRETWEETGLDHKDYILVDQFHVDAPKAALHYYITRYQFKTPLNQIILDAKEHTNYLWCNPAQWMQLDLIYDLKQHLIAHLL